MFETSEKSKDHCIANLKKSQVVTTFKFYRPTKYETNTYYVRLNLNEMDTY